MPSCRLPDESFKTVTCPIKPHRHNTLMKDTLSPVHDKDNGNAFRRQKRSRCCICLTAPLVSQSVRCGSTCPLAGRNASGAEIY